MIKDVLWGAGELEKHARADQLDAHGVLLARPVTELDVPAEGPVAVLRHCPVEAADDHSGPPERLD